MDDPETQDVAGQGDGGDSAPPMSESLGMPSGMAGLPTVPGIAQPGGPAPVRGSDAPKRHGGLLTGLVGVLLDGLTAGVTTPQGDQGMQQSAARAMQLPQQRVQQAQAAETATQQHQVQLAQMHIQMQQIKHMAASLNDQDLEGLTDTQKAVVGQAVKDGGLDLLGEANDREAAFKRAQELATQNKGEALNYMPLIARHDKDGNPVWGVYQLRGKNTLSSDQDMTISGSQEFKIPDENFHAPAGMPWSDAMKVYVQKTRDMQAKINAASSAKRASDIQAKKSQTAVDVAKIKANAPSKAKAGSGDAALDKSYQFNQTRLDKLRTPIDALAGRFSRLQDALNQNTPQADALVAPELLSVMAGGAGSGLRMNEAEISRIVGGRSKWESLQAAANKWQIDPKAALSITPEQRQEIRALVTEVGKKINAKQALLSDAQNKLIQAKDKDTYRQVVADAQKQIASIDTGKFPDRETATAVRNAQQPQGRPVRVNGQIVGYTTDGKTMTPVQ